MNDVEPKKQVIARRVPNWSGRKDMSPPRTFAPPSPNQDIDFQTHKIKTTVSERKPLPHPPRPVKGKPKRESLESLRARRSMRNDQTDRKSFTIYQF